MAKKCSLLLLAFVLYLIHCQSTIAQLQNKISAIDLDALHQIKNTLIDIHAVSSPHFFSSWDFASGDPCSSFAGVTCSSSEQPRRVESLVLGTGLSGSPGFAGTLSPFIANLTELSQLVLFAGIVTGSIPSELGSLKKLRVISLTNNLLTGTIPASIFSLPDLHTLDLGHNQLSGTMPPTISASIQLKVLVLADNKISGQLPRGFPEKLLHLDFSQNNISGMLPARMSASLRYLSASQNRMWGPLNCLESTLELEYLDLSMNNFSGGLPTSLFQPKLTSMLLQRNNLSGGFPPLAPYPYGPGSIIDLSRNFLTGELTRVLVGVESLFLNNNQLKGTVPKEYFGSLSLGKTKTLYLQHNYITGFPTAAESSWPPWDLVAVCISYNCMEVPVVVGIMACPSGIGEQISRPAYQCSAFHNRNTTPKEKED
ncbi:leucine-rich repeat receptor-like serine threonine- kinase BAM1 [Olea europaea subsp. europaea]|uniref:Leucine-rich repeat receptor-like serine threonine- kinase BAM1 n=1 Tax=Olea europaea subsp. europaea TaxID=158383 RepID=A0A8S0U0S2_OLEEU|nr:leucine-rich repeat receptor-like serine threonine- kinase BAM1 [Olea europaea subsp. europaea]